MNNTSATGSELKRESLAGWGGRLSEKKKNTWRKRRKMISVNSKKPKPPKGRFPEKELNLKGVIGAAPLEQSHFVPGLQKAMKDGIERSKKETIGIANHKTRAFC